MARGVGRLTLCGLLVAAAAACSGCTQLLSIGSTSVLVGMAVDAGPGGEVTATAEISHYPSPSGAGGSGGGKGGSTSPVQLVLQGSGPNLSAALASVQAQTDVFVDFWATSLLLVGQQLAQRGVVPSLDALLRSGQFALTSHVVVVEGSAGALLGQGTIAGGPSLNIERRLVHGAQTDLTTIPTPFWQFISRALTPYRAAWAPAFATTAQGYRSAGTAVFRGGRLAALLDPQQTAALGWLLKPGGFPPLNFTEPDGAVGTLRVLHVQRRVATQGPGAGLLTVKLDTTPQDAPGLQLLSPPAIRTNENGAQLAATADLRALLDRLQSSGSDVLGFGERLREADPAAVGANWPTVFEAMRIGLDVSVAIKPSGRLL
jgi:hypothetical protein